MYSPFLSPAPQQGPYKPHHRAGISHLPSNASQTEGAPGPTPSNLDAASVQHRVQGQRAPCQTQQCRLRRVKNRIFTFLMQMQFLKFFFFCFASTLFCQISDVHMQTQSGDQLSLCCRQSPDGLHSPFLGLLTMERDQGDGRAVAFMLKPSDTELQLHLSS